MARCEQAPHLSHRFAVAAKGAHRSVKPGHLPRALGVQEAKPRRQARQIRLSVGRKRALRNCKIAGAVSQSRNPTLRRTSRCYGSALYPSSNGSVGENGSSQHHQSHRNRSRSQHRPRASRYRSGRRRGDGGGGRRHATRAPNARYGLHAPFQCGGCHIGCSTPCSAPYCAPAAPQARGWGKPIGRVHAPDGPLRSGCSRGSTRVESSADGDGKRDGERPA
mgnify:CR=1 FL=1